MRVTVKLVGIKDIQDIVEALQEKAPQAISVALNQEADALMEESLKLVPVDTGQLRDSISKRQLWEGTRRLAVAVGYTAVYALSVHENPRSGKTGGLSPSGERYQHWAQTGQWKYLEQPMLAQTQGYLSRIQQYLYREWLGG